MTRSSLVSAMVLSLAFVASTAHAQETSRAQALFDDGRRLMNEGHYAEACPKLAASQKLDPGAGTLLNLGTCYEKNGQVASAWATFKDAAAASKASGHPDWEGAARARAEKLEPELARLVVVVPKEVQVAGLVVERDGSAIDPAEWATPIPIDSGEHTVRAVAPGKKAWSIPVTIGGARSTATVAVPMLEKDAGAAALASAVTPPHADAPVSSDGSTQRLVGLVLGGAGVVAIGVGTVFGLKAGSTYDDGKSHCKAAIGCDDTGLGLRDDASSQATISTIGFVAGGVLLAGGVALYLTAPHGAKTTGVRISPGGPGLAGMTMGGAF